MTALEILRLSNNALSGTVPAELGDLTSLVELRLHQNQLTGELPRSLMDLTSLRRLRIEDNAGLCAHRRTRTFGSGWGHWTSSRATAPPQRPRAPTPGDGRPAPAAGPEHAAVRTRRGPRRVLRPRSLAGRPRRESDRPAGCGRDQAARIDTPSRSRWSAAGTRAPGRQPSLRHDRVTCAFHAPKWSDVRRLGGTAGADRRRGTDRGVSGGCRARRALRRPCPRLRPPRVPQQDRARAPRRHGRASAPRADPGVLRVLRLALVRAWPLAAGPAGAPPSGHGDGGSVPRGAWREEPHRRPTCGAKPRIMRTPGRDSFERPYGLAWLLQLAAELRQWDDPDARRWRQALLPIETLAADRIRDWLPRLTHPIRSGEHSQTAFAFGLILGWARQAGDDDMIELIRAANRRLLRRGLRLSAALRALRAGLPVALPGRGGSAAPRHLPRCLRRLAGRIPAGDSGRRRRRLARAGGGDRSDRREAGPTSTA